MGEWGAGFGVMLVLGCRVGGQCWWCSVEGKSVCCRACVVVVLQWVWVVCLLGWCVWVLWLCAEQDEAGGRSWGVLRGLVVLLLWGCNCVVGSSGVVVESL